MIVQRRLRVLHIGKFYPPHMGGIETHLETLCRELQKSVDVKVVVANDGRHTETELLDGVEVTRVGTWATVAGASICPEMVRAIRESPADVVHLHFPNPPAVLAYLASGHQGRLVVTYHSDVVRQKVLSAAFEPFQRIALNRCSAIIATSPNYIESSPVLQRYSQRCRIIPFGIHTESLERADPAEVRAIRERFGSRIILSIGRLIYYKGFEHLIDAMAHVPGRLLIIGDGPLRPELEQRARANGLGDRVVFLGKVPDLTPYYHAADAFALASVVRSEAFGIVQIEAMATGTPVVNTSLDSGVPFVSRDGVTGLTVAPGDSRGLAQALNRLLDDAQLRADYGRAAKRRAREEFCAEVMTRRTLQLYEDVLSGDAARETIDLRSTARGPQPRATSVQASAGSALMRKEKLGPTT